MFAPRVAKPGSAAPQRPTVAAQRPSRSASEQAILPQRSIGSQAMLRPAFPRFLERRDPLQAKLMVGQVDDPLEHEADRVADEVMRMPDPTVSAAAAPPEVSRKCAACEEEKLQKKPAGPQTAAGEAAAAVPEVLRAPGQPLDAETRSFMEPRFGHDLGEVRVHSDLAAARSAQSLGSAAYAAGHDIAFAAGHFAPRTPTGRRLIAHELTHVVQQRRVGPFIQRDPLPQYKSTDPVLELKPVVKPEGDAWQLKVEGDFTTPAAVGRLIWPSRSQIPPGVSIKLIDDVIKVEGWPAGQERKPPTVHAQQAIFELTGVALFTLGTMDPLFAKMFADLGLVAESKSVEEARAKFRARHNSHSEQVLDNIDAALKRVTRNNPDLLVEYYRFYSDWKLTDDIASSSGDAGRTDRTIRRGGFTDINRGVLHLQSLPQLATDDRLSLLGTTLIHEYAHTSHASDYLKGPGEGKAYGIENFFNERLGDKLRDEATLDLGERMGGKTAFNTSYRVMKLLYEVIDTHNSKSPSLRGVSAQRARELSVEFISKNKDDFSDELKRFIIAEFGKSGYNSLPSQESR